MKDNIAEMPQDFWAWEDSGELVPLGVCEDFDEAFERAEVKCPTSYWVFSRTGLEVFKAEILRELP